jgi:hypothetical protein
VGTEGNREVSTRHWTRESRIFNLHRSYLDGWPITSSEPTYGICGAAPAIPAQESPAPALPTQESPAPALPTQESPASPKMPIERSGAVLLTDMEMYDIMWPTIHRICGSETTFSNSSDPALPAPESHDIESPAPALPAPETPAVEVPDPALPVPESPAPDSQTSAFPIALFLEFLEWERSRLP